MPVDVQPSLSVTRRQMLAMSISAPVAGAILTLSHSDGSHAAPATIAHRGDMLSQEMDAAFFGVRSDGTQDDTLALRAAIAALSANAERSGKQAILRLAHRCRTITSDEIVVASGVFLDLNGGLIEAHLAGGDPAGLVAASRTVIAHGAITVRSSGRPGIQAGAHAPLRVGPRYGSGSPSHPDPLDDAVDWILRDLVLLSDRSIVSDAYPSGMGAPGIQIYGGSHRGTIDNIVIPNNDRMRGGIMADWAPQGPISSLDIDMATNRVAYENGQALTKHPSDTKISRVFIGALTNAVPPSGPENGGSFGIRLSGVQRFRVSDISIVTVTAAAIAITAGDLGYEFAENRVRIGQMRGIVVDGVTVAQPMAGNADGGGNAGYLMIIDGDADNLRRAVARHGYRPMVDVAIHADIRINHVKATGSGAPLAQDGIRVRELHGASFSRLSIEHFNRGMIVDEGCSDIDISDSMFRGNSWHGLEIGSSRYFPRKISVHENVFQENGRSKMGAGLFIGNCADCSYWSNVFGVSGKYDPSQSWGDRIDGSIVNLRIPHPNTYLSTKIDGVGSSILDDTKNIEGIINEYSKGKFPQPSFINIKIAGNTNFIQKIK